MVPGMAIQTITAPAPVTTRSEAIRVEVRAHLARIGVTQGQLAKALGVSQQSVSDRMRGRTPWTLDETTALEHVLGLTPGALLHAALDAVPRYLETAKAPRRSEGPSDDVCAPRDLNPEPIDSGSFGALNHMIRSFPDEVEAWLSVQAVAA